MVIEVVRKVRKAVGPDFPVWIKMNSCDYLEDGLSLEDSLAAGTLLEKEGLDAMEISGGTFLSGELSPSQAGITREEQEAYFREAARSSKQRLNLPIVLVGGIRSLATAERLVQEGTADYLSLSRPLIREPSLIQRWEAGDQRPALCLSNNQCFKPAMAGDGLYCVVEKKRPDRSGGLVFLDGFKSYSPRYTEREMADGRSKPVETFSNDGSGGFICYSFIHQSRRTPLS